ncbi:MAG: response regulator [Anaerolineae bacterium]
MTLIDKTIFIVEDDVVNLAAVRMLLQKEGAHVPFDPIGSRTTQNLLEILSKPGTQVDLILLDLKLFYGISGYEVLKAIRAKPNLAHIPVVAFTAADPEQEIPKAQAAGFNGYITKPIERDHFIQDLSQILEGKPVWRSVR